ncbi:MAG TPA: protein TolR [Gammaproteobacteria bacterium]|nr:protein TolR [Gammaproteobacteria bacterium]
MVGGNVTRYKRRRMAEINVVPYIDVMLVLLIIFMVTAPLLTEGVKVELPRATAAPVDSNDERPVIITVNREGAYFISIGDNPRKPVEPATLVARVAAVRRHNPKLQVLVRGDTRASYGDVVGVMVLLQQAGVDDVGLITRSPDRRRR